MKAFGLILKVDKRLIGNFRGIRCYKALTVEEIRSWYTVLDRQNIQTAVIIEKLYPFELDYAQSVFRDINCPVFINEDSYISGLEDCANVRFMPYADIVKEIEGITGITQYKPLRKSDNPDNSLALNEEPKETEIQDSLEAVQPTLTTEVLNEPESLDTQQPASTADMELPELRAQLTKALGKIRLMESTASTTENDTLSKLTLKDNEIGRLRTELLNERQRVTEFQSLITDNEQKTEGLRATIDSLTKESERLRESNTAKAEELSQLKAEYEQSKSEATAKLNKQVDNFESELAKKDNELAHLTKETAQKLNDLKSRASHRESEYKRLLARKEDNYKKMLASKESDMTRIMAEREDEFSAQLEAKDTELKEHKQEIDTLKANAAKSEQEFNTRLSDEQAKYTALETELKAKEKESADLASKLKENESELDTLHNQLTDRETELAEFNAALEEKEQIVRRIEESKSQSEAERKRLKAELDSLTAELKTSQASLSEQTKLASETASKITVLNQQIEKLTAELSTTKQELNTRSEEVSALKQELHKRTSDIATLKQELRKRLAEGESLKKNLNTKIAELDTLSRKLTARTTELEALKSELSENAGELTGLRTALADNSKELETLRSELSTATSECHSLKTALSECTAELTDTQAELKAEMTESESLKQELETKTSELQSLHITADENAKSLAAVKASLNISETELKRLREKLKELPQLLTAQKRLKQRYLKLRDDHTACLAELDKCRDKLSRGTKGAPDISPEELTALKSRIEELEKENAEQVKTLNALRDKRTELKQKTEAKDKELAELKGELAALHKSSEENETSARFFERKVEALTSELKSKDSALSGLTIEVQELKTANTEANKQSERELDALRQQLKTSDTELNKALEDKVSLQQRADSLEQTLNTSQLKINELQKAVESAKDKPAPIINYTGRAKIIPVFGSGSYGITLTAMSLALSLKATKTLLIDMDLRSPKLSKYAQKNPLITGLTAIKDPMLRSGLGAFYTKGAGWLKTSNGIIRSLELGGRSSIDYLSGLYGSVSDRKILGADYTALFNTLGADYDYIILDMGVIGSEVSDKLIQSTSRIAHKNILITTNDMTDARAAYMKVTKMGLALSNIIWLLNLSRTTVIDESVHKLIKGAYAQILLTINADMYGSLKPLNKMPLVSGMFNNLVAAVES